ncbi:MAG: S8 family serine peptidase, partial [Rhizobiales bacterium]|nr:S8 family serine peptidase [Hyphomicrobiales bacterium]
GFLATTSDIRNADFMAGRMNFNIPGRPDASIVNFGNITASSGGFAALVAPGVRNSGTISANLGTVALASGNSFTLDMYGDKLIQVAVGDEIAGKVIDVATGKPLSSLVTNDGTLRANGGRVEITAAAARHVVDSVINNRGVIEANSVGTRAGKIVLGGATGLTKKAGLPKQTIKIAGKISATGKDKGSKGGTIQITGEDIQFAAAMLDVSGHSGGGKILVGGDYGGGRPIPGDVNNQSAVLESDAIPTATTVTVDGATTFNASATASGDGGKVILWSDALTTFAGTVYARGGELGGNGGFVEVSGKQQLAFTGTVNTLAPQGATGTLLLDPADFYIDLEDGPARPAGASVMTNVQVQNLLATNDVVISTDNNANPAHQYGDIRVNANITWSGDNSLTLSAYRNVVINATITNVGNAPLTLRADNTGTGTGKVKFGETGTVDYSDSTGTVSIFYNPWEGYSNPTDFTGVAEGNYRNGVFVAQPSQLTAYMLVNTAADLQQLGTSAPLDEAYALGRDIDASGLENFKPIGNHYSHFKGVFDGQGHTISNLTIAPKQSVWNIGLFGVTAIGSEIRNLNLTNVSVTANPNVSEGYQYVGTVVGQNAGKLTNVTAQGTVNGAGIDGVIAGGLVGMVSGTITQSSAAVNVTVSDATENLNYAGGLAGRNDNAGVALIDQSHATGDVTGGAHSFVGGLVGENLGSITASMASGTVNSTATGANFSSAVGGLVGVNKGLVSGSHATGSASGVGASDGFFAAIVGGLVGLNNEGGEIVNSHATGAVSGTNQVQLGGLVGGNFGAIIDSYATGDVTGHGPGTIGGLVGTNFWGATITDSQAFGNVAATVIAMGYDYSAAGGLVGENLGIITSSSATPVAATTSCTITASFSCATGNVSSATGGSAGGLVGANHSLIDNTFATGNVTGGNGVNDGGMTSLGGLVGWNSGVILNSLARTGTIGSETSQFTAAGGLVGDNFGSIANSGAFGNVVVGEDSVAGGFAGFNVGQIALSYARGTATAGNGSSVGGFVGFNVGEINQAYAVGSVAGGANSYVGGFVGINLGLETRTFQGFSEGGYDFDFGSITQSYALGATTGGNEAVAAAFAALNLGSLDQVYGVGRVQGGAGSTLGGLVGLNNLSASVPDMGVAVPEGTLPTGTATNSYWDTQTTAVSTSAGGTGTSTAVLAGGLPAGFDAETWGSHSYPYLLALDNPPNPPQNTDPPPPDNPPTGVSDPFLPTVNQQINANTFNVSNTSSSDPIPNTAEFVQQQQQQQAQQQGSRLTTGSTSQDPIRLDVGENRYFYLPPPSETRLVANEVVLQMPCNIPQATLDAILKQHNLSVVASQCLQEGGGNAAFRVRHASDQTIATVIRALATHQIIAAAQANYLYTLAETSVQSATSQQGDPGQYVPEKLRLFSVHKLVRGTNVSIAVIDSEIDGTHPDLSGTIAKRYDATGVEDQPHAHGTGMAGAIVSHQKLLGVAPDARILAIRAFSTRTTNPESTTFHILRGIDHAVANSVRIINMSFAGPRDPSLERAIKAAYDKGIIMVAAAGNAGPRAPALYPAADPNVIAVTATDLDDRLFTGANRGTHLAIAAPGVDILVPAPAGEYQVTTGTSVATAHISGVVALMLERNPKLTPADVRKILAASAKRLGATNQFGAGLVDPVRALEMAAPRSAAAPGRRP